MRCVALVTLVSTAALMAARKRPPSGDPPSGEEPDETPPSREVDVFREPDEDGPEDELSPDEVVEDDLLGDLEGRLSIPLVPTEPRAPGRARIIAVSGAKGGVGKSVIAANIGLYLASIGRRVVMVDADPAGANLHTMLGAPMARAGSPPIATLVQGLSLAHAGLDEGLSGARVRARRSALLGNLASLAADYVVVDLGASATRAVIDSFLAADLSLFVTLPEPTALENTYRFIRRAFLRHLRRTVESDADRRALMQKARELGGAPPPLDLWRALEDDGDPLADLVRQRMEAFHPAVVLNQTRLRADLDLGEAMRSAARRRLGVQVSYMGHVEHDDTVWSTVRARKLLLIESPGTKAAKNIERIARRLLAAESGKRRVQPRVVPPESHHDLLEVERGATDEEVRRAFKRARDIYADDALACYGLFTTMELAALRTRLEEAFDVLLDSVRRRPYELSVFPPDAEIDELRPRDQGPSEPLPPPPELTPDTDYTGALLRAVRESRGVRLEEISQKTKVGLPYLVAIEADDFASLPAPVYVRGFVTELAKFLKLDVAQVSRTYGRRLRRWLDEKGRVA